MERATGIEPATSSLGSWRSTIELRPLSERVRRLFTRAAKVNDEESAVVRTTESADYTDIESLSG